LIRELLLKSYRFNHEGEIVSVSQKDFEQIFPKPGWVEHDPKKYGLHRLVAAEVIAKVGFLERNSCYWNY
jgi:glycerol kinase